jgi:hypothetical protein
VISCDLSFWRIKAICKIKLSAWLDPAKSKLLTASEGIPCPKESIAKSCEKYDEASVDRGIVAGKFWLGDFKYSNKY